MTFAESVKLTLTKNYVKFSGRASRSEFWWFQLFVWLLMVVLGLLMAVIFGISLSTVTSLESGVGTGLGAAFVGFGIMCIVGLALFLPELGLIVRRLHDRDISGWWLLLLVALRLLSAFGFVFIALNLIANIVLLVLYILPGTRGPNRFGPDPLKPDATADVFA